MIVASEGLFAISLAMLDWTLALECLGVVRQVREQTDHLCTLLDLEPNECGRGAGGERDRRSGPAVGAREAGEHVSVTFRESGQK